MMTVFAGEVGKSDRFFMVGGARRFHQGRTDMTPAEQELISTVADCICDQAAAPGLKHTALQLALVLVSGLGQLSPGAYFLRTDLFPAIVDVRRILFYDVINRPESAIPPLTDHSRNRHSKIHL